MKQSSIFALYTDVNVTIKEYLYFEKPKRIEFSSCGQRWKAHNALGVAECTSVLHS